MAYNKEAIVLVLDVSPSMCDASPGQDSPLQSALDAITMIVQRKIFAESKDEIGLVLFGTVETDNPLASADDDEDNSYRNVSVARRLDVASFDFLDFITKYTHSKTTSADYIDALIVAMDHLQGALENKKGFKNKQVILLSNFDNPFEDDQLNHIIAGMKNQGTELNVIGPDLDYEVNEDDGSGDTLTNGIKKEKTKQQRAGEAIVKRMLKETNGNSYSFGEALSMLSHFTSRQTTPTAWKCDLEIGDLITIPIHGYIKLKAHKLKQSWKKVYAKDHEATFKMAKTFHLNDEEETEVGFDEICDGFRYGSTLVPMTDKDKKEMKYKSEKCFKVLGFTRADNVPSHSYMGDSTMCVVADPSDNVMTVMLSALINALYETNTVSIVRRVYNSNSAPKVGCLVPHIKTNYECLMYHELPFSEDVRSNTFASLPMDDDDGPAKKKFKPTAEQLSAVDDLISAMDLTTADEDEDGEPCEFLKPKLTFNPHFQKLYQCLQHRALNPQEPLPELSPLMARQLEVPKNIANACKSSLEAIKNKFKLEVIQKKEVQTGQSFFKDTIESKPSTKNTKEGDLKDADNIADIIKTEVTQIGTITPVEDFQTLLSSGKDFVGVGEQMQKQILKIVTESIGNQFYKKAMECLKTLRKESIAKNKPKEFNNFLVDFKTKLLAKARTDFWEEIVKEKQSLISKVDCEGSQVTLEEAEKFLCKEQAAAKTDTTSNAQDSAEDLLDEM